MTKVDVTIPGGHMAAGNVIVMDMVSSAVTAWQVRVLTVTGIILL